MTPLKISVWIEKSKFCNDPRASWVLDGIQFGFKVGFSSGMLKSAEENMSSASSNPSVVDDYLKKQSDHGSIAGPFSDNPINGLHFNRSGLIPKPVQGEWRMITDLSFPNGNSVNDFIPDSEPTVKHTSADDAIALIMKCGRGVLMGKFDIKSADRISPIHTSDRFLVGMRWRRKIFIDLCLAFGFRSACRIFNDFPDILEWMLKFCAFILFLMHYLDDFFLTGPAGTTVCRDSLEKAKFICSDLGVPLTPEKTFVLSTTLPYLGTELDSLQSEARLPLDKLLKAKDLVLKWLSKRSGKKRKLLSLIGYLQHCFKVIVPAHPFFKAFN